MSEEKGTYNTKAQTIFRIEKNKDNPYVMIDRRLIENPKLSWQAKGLLAYLLSRPDNWTVHFKDLVKRAPDGGHTVRAAMKELRNAGHVKLTTERENGRVRQWIYTIHELPDADFQQVEKQLVENRTLNNKELKQKELKDAAAPLSSKDMQEIKTKAKKTFDGLLENERRVHEKDAVGQAWRGRELCPPNYLKYGDWWHQKTNQHMYGEKAKAKINTEWLKAFKEWWENDLTTDVLGQVYDAEKGWRGSIEKPSIITTKAIALQALPPEKPRTEPESTDEYNQRVLQKIKMSLGVTA